MQLVRCDKCGKELSSHKMESFKIKEERRCKFKFNGFRVFEDEVDVCTECFDEIMKMFGYEKIKNSSMYKKDINKSGDN